MLALCVWTRDDDAQLSTKPTEVEVWAGDPESVTALSFESSTRKLRIEPKKDALGRWYVGTVDKDEPANVPTPPHGGAGGAPVSESPPPAKHVTSRFVGVKAADDFAEDARAAARAARGGQDRRHARRRVRLRQARRHAEAHRRRQAAVLADRRRHSGRYRTLREGSQRRRVRDLRATSCRTCCTPTRAWPNAICNPFKPEEATRVKVSKAGKSRDLSRVPDKNEGWADSATPTKLDETAGNWMTKLGRLHVQDWVEKPSAAPGPDSLVVHVDYFAGSKPLGSLELYKLPGDKGNEYLAKSDYGRWFARVITSSAEQVDQDSASLVK